MIFICQRNREKSYFGLDSKTSFLKEANHEYESLLVESIKEYCRTPIFPIEINESDMIPSFVDSVYFRELADSEKHNMILDAEWEDEEYDYAFSDDYRCIDVLDKDNMIVLNIAVGKEMGVPLSLKGMRLSQSIFMPELSEQNLEILYLDILAGNSSEMVDASRSQLTDAAEQKVRFIVEKSIKFARAMFLRLMDRVWKDETFSSFHASVSEIAKQYYSGKFSEKQVWKSCCALKKEYYYQPIAEEVSSVECRTITYMIALAVKDEVMLRDIRSIEHGYYKSPLESWKRKKWKAFPLLDDIIRRWKADKKCNEKYSDQRHFEEQMRKILEHDMQIWGMMTADFYLRKRTISSMAELNKWEAEFQKIYKNYFPYMGVWKESRGAYRIADAIVFGYRGDEMLRHESPKALNALIFPTAWDVFEEKVYRGEYAGQDALYLYMTVPFARCFLDLIDGDSIENEIKRIWKRYMEKVPYGYFRFDLEIPDMKSLLEENTIWMPINDMLIATDSLPFLENLAIDGIRLSENKLEIGYELASTDYGMRADELVRRIVFRRFWKDVEKAPRAGKNYQEIPGFEEYEQLIFKDNESAYDYTVNTVCKNKYIPAWDYLYNIQTYLNDYRCDSSDSMREECLEGIVHSKQFDAVTKFIWRSKYSGRTEHQLEEIQLVYRRLLKEMLDVWFEEMPRG